MERGRVPRSRSWLLVAVAVGLAARLAFSLLWWVDKPLTLDEQEYVTLGKNLASGRGLVYDEDGLEHFGRPPGYPAFLAVILAAGGDVTAARAVQSITSAATIVVIAVLAAEVAGPPAALVAAAIAAVHLPLVSLPAYMLSETLYSFLALGAAALLARTLSRGGRGLDFATGIATGLAMLVRSAALPWVGLVAAALVLRGRAGSAITVVLGAVLVVAPWAAFKSHQSGRFMLVASDGGVNFWTGNNPVAVGEGDMSSSPELERANAAIRAAHPDLGYDALEAVYYGEGLRFIREDPGSWLVLEAKKLFYCFVPIGPSYMTRSRLYRYTNWATYLPILVLALAGLPRVAAAGERALPLALLALSVLAVALVFLPLGRYRLPVLDPVLIVCASAYLAGRSNR